jgi:two-component system, NarL family, nitrate/nitrite response regulator NarL
MGVIDVVVADDHPIVRRAICELFRTAGDIRVVRACADGTQAMEAIRETRPSVAVLDVSMPNMTGLEVLSAANREHLPTRILLLAASAGSRDIITAMSEGAYGFLLKDSKPDKILACVREIAAGRKCLPFESLERSHEIERQDQYVSIERLLTPREWKVMALATQGLSNKEIGRQLNMTAGTAKIHLHHVFQKIGVKNRTALATVAFRYTKDEQTTASRQSLRSES